MRRGHYAIAGLVLAVVAFLALNFAAGLTLGTTQIDLTEGRIFSLSKVTTDTLDNLQEPVRIRFYVSPALLDLSGQYSNYATHVRSLLDVYRRRSHGHIEVEVISPESYSPEEDRAVGFGLRGMPVDNDGNEAYFGIAATNSTDRTEIIPFLSPEREVFLEYDLTKLIEGLATPKKPVIGLLDGAGAESGQPSGEGGGGPWISVEQVRQIFTVQPVMPDATSIDAAVSVLLILHPKDLSPATTFAIDQFVLGGGHALIFVDPDAESVAGSMDSPMGPSGGGASDLPELFKAWGVEYDPTKVAGDWDQALEIRAESFGRPVTTTFPPFIGVRAPYLNGGDPVSGDLKTVNMLTTGAFRQTEGARTAFTPLMTTSPHARLVDAADTAGTADPLAFLSKYKPGDGELTLAARIVGPASTAFPDGPPQEKKPGQQPAKPPAAYLKEAKTPIDVILVGDVDMLADHSWVDVRAMGNDRVATPEASNGDFLINALENLTGSPTLSSLRARGVSSRPLVLIEQVQREADEQYRKTEDDLSHKLQDARRQLQALAPGKGATDAAEGQAPTEQQQQTVKHFRAEMSETRQQLREVQLNLRREIDRLERQIKFVDIGLVPGAVVLFALLLALGRRGARPGSPSR